MKNLINLLILVIMILMISCESEEAKQKAKEDKLKLKDEIEIKHLSEKYKAIRVSKPLKSFTYQLQETFIEHNKLICFEGSIIDIIKIDSSFTLKVYIGASHGDTSYLALITVKSIKFIEINKILQSTNHSKKGCFIFNISKIYSFKPEIALEEPEEGGPFLTFDFDSTLLYFKGELIDFYLNETND